ncbi:CBS domain-containing protein [Microbacterium sp. zg.B48]|uniref:CBS domain-containing protein n=1 Tax=unclassified Microbacterium TaxID=2609290 RepID=UPI00214BBEF8|nr:MULTISPECIES: CBS domain-containing protein [unclassified Microbacterium]MCR2763387.1 CBS domain-containing protein [Microbacterium sp. zg.B48]MCR2809108.1 CBS domain-containing protein [Microbacterium sp. zg.B185]WIM20261.1 CBS domain-containing protein [Microbacterium sp. zg-B185]
MTKARDIMTPDPRCIGENETLVDAARLMAELDVGALPICGEDQRLKGMLTDRDIVVKCLAQGGDPAQTRAGSLGEGKPVTIGADDDVREALTTMENHQVRRLPVIDGHDLVGMISQADIALSLSATETGETVEAISE